MEEHGIWMYLDEIVKSKFLTPKLLPARSLLEDARSLQHKNLELREEVDKLEGALIQRVELVGIINQIIQEAEAAKRELTVDG